MSKRHHCGSRMHFMSGECAHCDAINTTWLDMAVLVAGAAGGLLSLALLVYGVSLL